MTKSILMLSWFVLVAGYSPFVMATDVTSCENALVVSTYNSVSSDHVDFRLATLVTQSTYDQVKHDAGANATIYGVPVGASYGDFTTRTQSMVNASATSLTHDQAVNVAQTGLSAIANSAYATCLNSLISMNPGLHLMVRYSTNDKIGLVVTYFPTGGASSTISPMWQPFSSVFPTSISAGSTAILVDRPASSTLVAINFQGFTDQVVLEPLPPRVPTPTPEILDQSKLQITSTEPHKYTFTLSVSPASDGNIYINSRQECGGLMQGANYMAYVSETKRSLVYDVASNPAFDTKCSPWFKGTFTLMSSKDWTSKYVYFEGSVYFSPGDPKGVGVPGTTVSGAIQVP